MKMRNPSPARRGFTLIELLVVVAIIALLISILLPSLSAAKKLAKSVACAAKIKNINLAMSEYATEFNNAIVGNAHTSSSFLLNSTATALDTTNYGDTNLPRINQTFDWTAPVADIMKIPFDSGSGTLNRARRYKTLSEAAEFICPENDILSPPYLATVPGNLTEPMLSYVTAEAFQYVWKSGASSSDQVFYGFSTFNFAGYIPRVDLVGNPSSKVFIADGAKYWNAGQAGAPDCNLAFDGGGSPGGRYSDVGPWDVNTRSYIEPDGLAYAMRHGKRSGATLAGSKFNVGFFDDHVETMTGLDGANPNMWAPKGSTISSSEANSETIAKYFNGGGSITVP